MISEDTVKAISHMFCGDIEGFYRYKTGSELVAFFNRYFQQNDKYGPGFPSRWIYIYNKLVEFIKNSTFDRFLNVILSKDYLISDMGLSQVEASERSETIYNELNRVFNRDQFKIVRNDGIFHLCEENADLELIGSGGFANVFRQKSTGHVIKQLKDDFLTDRAIRSRFKREYDITKSLQDVHGIIPIFTFNESNCSYSMILAERTLDDYIKKSNLSNDEQIKCIRQILYIMNEVHQRDVVHRDISPKNVFILQGQILIADFGLGKDLNVFTSHQTLLTNALGTYLYCAPEQFMLLRDGDKRSDVYSLGRLINFIMTKDPADSHHIFRSITEKASCQDAQYRYADTGQLAFFLEKSIAYHQRKENDQIIDKKISEHVFDVDVETYIYEMTSDKICTFLLEQKSGFSNALLNFMKCDASHAQHIIESIEKSYQDVCGRSFSAYDPFAGFAYKVLVDDFVYIVKEIAANILRYVATIVNRYYAQGLVDDIKKQGIEPLLEDILDS